MDFPKEQRTPERETVHPAKACILGTRKKQADSPAFLFAVHQYTSRRWPMASARMTSLSSSMLQIRR